MPRFIVLLFFLTLVHAQEKGSLLIESQPGTEVIWDGIRLDITDRHGKLSIEEIPLGRFSLVLKKAGYQTLSRQVEIRPGALTLVLPLQPISRSAIDSDTSERQASGAAHPPDALGAQRANKQQPLPPEFQVKEKGEVPVWPENEKKESAEPETQTLAGIHIGFWIILGGLALVLASIWYLVRLRRSRIPVAATGPALLPGEFEEEPVKQPPPEPSIPFLTELKIREEMMEQGVEIVNPKPKSAKSPIIDLDAASVREVEEKS